MVVQVVAQGIQMGEKLQDLQRKATLVAQLVMVLLVVEILDQ
jgi:hypothetical protein